MTNRADSTNHSERPSRGEVLSTPLTERDGIPLREEVYDYGNVEGDRPLPWRESVHRWRDYIEDNEDTDAVFQNADGEYAIGGDPHRFATEYAHKQYAKLKDLQRGLQEEYGKRLHTAMLTFTASWCPDGEPVPPVDHLLELDSSWDAIRRELSRQLGDRRWEYLGILEPHPSNAYFHIHMAVFVDGVVTRDAFAPVIEAHVRNCELAEHDAHDPESEDTISIRHAGKDRDECGDDPADHDGDGSLDELAIYLAEYLGTYGDDPLTQPDHQQMSNTVLWATGKQRWRPSQGAQSYMAAEQADDDESGSEWELVGIRSGTEYYPCEQADGGVDRFVTSSLDPPAG